MTKSTTIENLAKSLKAFQAEIGNVPKDSVNPFFKSKYASLESVINVIKPVLAKHGLSYVQFPDGKGLTTVLIHDSGEFIEATGELVLKDQTPQGQGSAITYMRRYALSAVLGIATEDDDDGNHASATKTPVKATQKPTEPPKSVVVEQKKAQVKKLCDDKALVPLFDKADYAKYVLENTGLVLEEGNLDAIIERLTALK